MVALVCYSNLSIVRSGDTCFIVFMALQAKELVVAVKVSANIWIFIWRVLVKCLLLGNYKDTLKAVHDFWASILRRLYSDKSSAYHFAFVLLYEGDTKDKAISYKWVKWNWPKIYSDLFIFCCLRLNYLLSISEQFGRDNMAVLFCYGFS